MQTRKYILKNHYAHRYLTRDLSKFNSSIVLNPQTTKTYQCNTLKLDTHSEATLREAQDYIHDLASYFWLDEDLQKSINWQINIIFKRNYIENFFNHAHYESIVLACMICAYYLQFQPVDELRIVAYITSHFKQEVIDDIISNTNRCYIILCGLHNIPENNVLITQLANHFYMKDMIKPKLYI